MEAFSTTFGYFLKNLALALAQNETKDGICVFYLSLFCRFFYPETESDSSRFPPGQHLSQLQIRACDKTLNV